LIAASDEAGVAAMGVSFYLMEPIDGFNPVVGLPPLHAGSPKIQHRMGLAVVDGIVALGALDPVALGLADFGRSDQFLERQAPRWSKQLASYAEFEGWPGPQGLPAVAEIAAWLEANRPSAFRPGIMHGDYHMANVMFRNDGPELAAIVDWELATIGDPLLDLGWLLATWAAPGEESEVSVKPWIGFPTADELVARYAAGSTRDLGQVGWYAVLACYKLAILLEGTHARACAGKAPRQAGDKLHHRAVWLLDRATKWIA
jgi:aminoglycoside phosphotransferase (APT) family kinase protein